MSSEIKMIRTIWNLVETSNPYNLIKLSDLELSQQLIEQIEKMFFLSLEDSQIISQYIGSRMMLIRDLAYSKVN